MESNYFGYIIPYQITCESSLSRSQYMLPQYADTLCDSGFSKTRFEVFHYYKKYIRSTYKIGTNVLNNNNV